MIQGLSIDEPSIDGPFINCPSIHPCNNQGAFRAVRQHPHIIIIPLFALGLMVGLGVWGVLAASNDSANAKKDDARASATEVATGFELQLKETFTPAVTLQLMIEQNPSWPFWEAQFAPIVDQLIARVRRVHAPATMYDGLEAVAWAGVHGSSGRSIMLSVQTDPSHWSHF